jgi:prepilin-type N-terminal cleavage/methylation domain-containing protein
MKNSKGFSLVEVLVALLVLGLAIALAMPTIRAVWALRAAKPAVETLHPPVQRRWVNPTAPAAPAAPAEQQISSIEKAVNTDSAADR